MNFEDNKNMKTKILKKNLSFLLPVFLLLIVSLLDMYGASFISPLYKSSLTRQLIWCILSIVVFLIIYKIDIKLLLKCSPIFYIIGIISLILVLFFGKNVNGANSWFKIGPVSIQPSEVFKFFYILFLSHIIGKHKGKNLSLFIKIIIITFIPAILIFLEPDTGVVIMYLLIMVGAILASKIDKKYIILTTILFLLGLSVFFGVYIFNKDLFIDLFGTSFFYRIDRLLKFTNNNSYQLDNALIGIGASGPLGLGLTNYKIYVPEITTDFVFTLTILNFGYIMGILIILIYGYLLFKLFMEIKKTKKYVYKTILSGIFAMMFFQVCEHIFMNLGLTPITGITLPFLSYGGSSLLSYFMLLALVLKISKINISSC